MATNLLTALTSLQPEQNGQLSLPFPLTGSQRKTAFALRYNAARMIQRGGLNATGFLTLTVGDKDPETGKFIGVRDSSEASRRIDNLNRRVLKDLFEQAIIVTERHKSGAVHFHVLGILRGRPDIRTGFSFKDVERGDYRSASEELRAVWAHLREVLPHYGFGRAELLPIKKTGEAVATYAAKYIEKNICNRLPEDKRKKLVRYLGWNKEQLKPNEFEWNGNRAKAWRGKAVELGGLIGCELRDAQVSPAPHVSEGCAWSAGKIRPKMFDGSQAKSALGPRWAYFFSEIIRRVSDQHVPFMVWDYAEREVVKNELAKIAGQTWCRTMGRERGYFIGTEFYRASELRAEMPEFLKN